MLLFASDPNAARVLLKQGLLALQHGQLAEAQNNLEQASKLDTNNAYVWSSLAEVYLRVKQPEKALDAAKTAESAGAGNPVISHALAMFYSEAGDPARAAELEEKYAESGKGDANALARAADLYAAAGDQKRALPLLQTAWERAQTDPQIAFAYAEALLRSQQFSEAAAVADTTLRANPKNAQLTLTLGVARYGQRRFDEAITLFLQTIAIDPAIQQPYEFVGRVLDQAGAHMPEILKDYETWAAKNPQNATAQMLLAKAVLAEDPKSKRAEDLLHRSIALDDRDWEAHYELGVLLANEHDYAEAAKELSRATELNEKQPMPHYHLARVYDRLGEPEKAKAEREIHKTLTASGSNSSN